MAFWSLLAPTKGTLAILCLVEGYKQMFNSMALKIEAPMSAEAVPRPLEAGRIL